MAAESNTDRSYFTFDKRKSHSSVSRKFSGKQSINNLKTKYNLYGKQSA